MSRFVERTTARVDLGEGDWVEIRTRLTFGDRKRLEEILLGNRTTTKDPAALHHRDANLELLRLSIAAWGGPGFCELTAHPHDGECRPRPITTANLEQLDETGERVLEEIRKSQVTQSAFLATTRNTSTGTASRPDSAPSSSTTKADPRVSDAGATSATSPSGSTSSSSASVTAGPGTN